MIQRFQSKTKFKHLETQSVLLCSVSSGIMPLPTVANNIAEF